MAKYIGAIDQGTTSSRFIVFDRSGRIVTTAQKEHEQIYPKPGWVEHNPDEIWAHTQEVIAEALKSKNLSAKDLDGIGITNQRETTVVWNKKTGKPVYNALVWQDTRTADYVAEYSRLGGQDQFRRKTGLPLATYFSGLKIKWILENVPGVRDLAEAGDVLFGNIDTYLIWQLTGGTNGGIHVTDWAISVNKPDGSAAHLPVPGQLRPIPASVPAGPPRNVAVLYREFARAISDGLPAAPDFATAARFHQLLENIQRASDTGIRQIL